MVVLNFWYAIRVFGVPLMWGVVIKVILRTVQVVRAAGWNHFRYLERKLIKSALITRLAISL